MTAFQNNLGGRVVVTGYAPWLFIHSVAKRAQLQNVTDWISRGRMPVRIEETVPLFPVVRLSPNRRKGAVVLINTGLDDIPAVTLRLRVAATRARVLAVGQPARATALEKRGNERVLTLHRLAPWSVRVVLLDTNGI
jgi:hypothetical protein